jgi:ADP-ribose pyrophosphatase YjhB (NUDIX family)
MEHRTGKPPRVFPGGKIEPGVSPRDATVREVFEETGLRVWATGVLRAGCTRELMIGKWHEVPS